MPSSLTRDAARPKPSHAGIKWLFRNYRGGQGCVLGDEMGLGKTIQVGLTGGMGTRAMTLADPIWKKYHAPHHDLQT